MARKANKRAVLVIEDDDETRKFICRVVKLAGYQVLQAGEADEGLQLARQKDVALVLLDLKLRAGNDWSTLAKMKSEAALSRIPVIVFTGSASGRSRQKALSMGVADFLVKPASASDLMAAMARVLH